MKVYIIGSGITELETLIADYIGVKFCIWWSLGVDSLLIPLMPWEIGPGETIFTTPFSFIVTAK